MSPRQKTFLPPDDDSATKREEIILQPVVRPGAGSLP